MNTYQVKITVGGQDFGTYVVERADEWKARTAAMGVMLMESEHAERFPSGAAVDYVVTEI